MKVFGIVVLLSLVSACGGIAVSTDYDTAYDFTSVRTYAWLEPKAKLIIDPYVDNDLMNRRLHRAVDQTLLARSVSKLDDVTKADVLISYHLSSHQKLSVTNYHSHFGYYPCRSCYPGGSYHHGSNISVKQYRAGAFIIDVIDPDSKELIWRGVSERRLPQSATPQERDLFVSETVSNILSKFP